MGDKKGEVKWTQTQKDTGWRASQTVVDPKYSKVGERIRHLTPGALQCSMFCGGKQCKYENPVKWKEDDMAIKGTYSSWITERILAMARPSTFVINKYNVIDQFKKNNITAIINLQHPGEHSSCGFGLEDGGFSYVPQQFMDEDVFFYNFGWDDYGVRALQSILDMVKVMDFALMDGKVAIHCHAGLGRTGVLIACYFVYSLRITADEAINKVRAKRPRAIQTRGQIACVRDFEKYLQPMWIIFANVFRSNISKPFSLTHFLSRQAHILHGEEERDLRYVPKIIFVTCQRLLNLAGMKFDLRSIAVLKRRGFNSLSYQHGSQDSVLSQDNCGSTTVKEKQPKLLYVGDTSEGLKRSSDSDFLKIQEKESSDYGLEDRRYFDATGDSNDFGEIVEVEQKRSIHHAASESVLLSQRKTDIKLTGEGFQNLQVSDFDKTKTLQPEHTRTSAGEESTVNDSVFVSESMSADMEPGSVLSSLTLDTSRNDSGIVACGSFDVKKVRNGSHYGSDSQEKVSMNEQDQESSIKTGISHLPTSNNSFTEVKFDISAVYDTETMMENIATSINSKLNDTKASAKVEQYKVDLNTSDFSWRRLETEADACILCYLLWHWLDHLEEPIITDADIEKIIMHQKEALKGFEALNRDRRKTLHVVLYTFHSLTTASKNLRVDVLQKIAMVFTKDKSTARKPASKKAATTNSSDSDNVARTGNCSVFLNFLELLCAALFHQE